MAWKKKLNKKIKITWWQQVENGTSAFPNDYLLVVAVAGCPQTDYLRITFN